MEGPLHVELPGRLAQVSVVSDPTGTPRGAEGAAAGPASDGRETDRLLETERNELKLARLALESGLERVRRLESEWAAQAEEQVVNLALAVAAKVLMQEIRAGRHEIDPIVKGVLERLPANQDVVVRMHPKDLSRSELARAAGPEGGAAGVRFVADATVKRAECIVETPQGFVKADVESHLRALAAALRAPE